VLSSTATNRCLPLVGALTLPVLSCPHNLPAFPQAERGHDTYGRAVKLLSESTRLLRNAVEVSGCQDPSLPLLQL
jgi:hypothetical protein